MKNIPTMIYFARSFRKSIGLLGMFYVLSTDLAAQTSQTAQDYPQSPKAEVQDDYHGFTVPDPYRWLEDTESAETAKWVAAQNEVTQAYLESLPQREPMRRRLEKLWNCERCGIPRHRGDRYFYTHNDGLQDDR